MIYQIPFRSNSAYSFTTNAGGSTYKIHIKYDLVKDKYYMDIDKQVGAKWEEFSYGISLTCGTDLLLPYQGYGMGNMFLVPVEKDYYDKEPTAETLISKYILLWEHN